MKVFSGFPAGKLTVTPLPNLFFSELLVAIDDLAELKVTLHIMWWLANDKAAFFRASDLRADRALMQSLAAVEPKPEQALTRGLELAVERGTLLRLSADEPFYFLNTDKGRRALEKMETNLPALSAAPEPAAVSERPNIFTLYEQNIGLLTPIMADELRDAEKLYPTAWIEDALKLAVKNNKRSWSYAHSILKRWKTEGRAESKKKSKPWWNDEYDKYVKR